MRKSLIPTVAAATLATLISGASIAQDSKPTYEGNSRKINGIQLDVGVRNNIFYFNLDALRGEKFTFSLPEAPQEHLEEALPEPLPKVPADSLSSTLSDSTTLENQVSTLSQARADTVLIPADCKPDTIIINPDLQYSDSIKEVTAHVLYQDGTTESISLYTERRPMGRDTGIPIDGGKRVLPLELKDVKAVKFAYGNDEAHIRMDGTAIINGVETDITDILADRGISIHELKQLGGELDASWRASKFNDKGQRTASLEGKIDLDKTRTIEVPGPATTVVDTVYAKPDTVEVPVQVSDNKNSEWYGLIGVTSGPAAKRKLGPEYTLGVDNVAGSRFGLFANIGGISETSNLVDETHVVEYLGNNRRHKFDREVIDENDKMTKVGAGLAYEILDDLRLEIGAGMFLGNRRQVENRSIGITDLDGNYIGVDNPVRDSRVTSEHKSEPYWSVGGRVDLGKWQVDAKYHKEVDTKGNGFSVGIGRKF